MSEILVDNLTGKTSAGDITVTSEGGSATMQLQQGLVKCWVNLDSSGTISVLDSFNNASVTDNATGDFTFNFSNNMSNSSYSAVADGQSVDLNYPLKNTGVHTLATGSERHNFGKTETTKQDLDMSIVQIAGDLA